MKAPLRVAAVALLAVAAVGCSSATIRPAAAPSPSESGFNAWFDGGGYKLALQLGTDLRTLRGPALAPNDELEVCQALSEHTTKAIAYGPIPDADKQLHWKQMLDYLDEASSECTRGDGQGDAHESLSAEINLEAAQREAQLLGSVLNGHSESP